MRINQTQYLSVSKATRQVNCCRRSHIATFIIASQVITSTVQMIDSISSLEKLLNKLNYYLHKPAALFLDVQTINLGEDGLILIISLFV
jgi:hypothetical protein